VALSEQRHDAQPVGDAASTDPALEIRAQELVAAAEAEAEEIAEGAPVLGEPGPPVSRRSPFMVGLLGAAGVAVTYLICHLLVLASSVLALIGLALFLAIGLEPAVQRLISWRLPRWAAVSAVAAGIVAVVGGFLAAAIPLVVSQATAVSKDAPGYLRHLFDRSPTLNRLDSRYHLHDKLANLVSTKVSVHGILGASSAIGAAVTATVTVLILTIYLLADLPRIRRLVYRLVPAPRRPRAILLGDDMFAKVGAFVVGNLLTSLIAGAGTFVWLLLFHVPYAILLSVMVALFDLVPIVGSTVAGIIVTLVALTVSLPIAIATLVFYVVYRLAEDYLIVPRIMGRAVEVPPTVTVIAVLIGGAVLGLIGALIAIPVAAAINVLLRESIFPRMDEAE
jgi:predicted PurR-regulated permease PerM